MKTLMPVVIASVLAAPAFAQSAADGSAVDATESPTMEAREKYTEMFHQLDEDKDNALDMEELANTGLSEQSIAHLDVNDDGTLSLDEFLALARS